MGASLKTAQPESKERWLNMAVNSSRSMNRSLDKGATEGSYRQVRPNTEVIDQAGNAATLQARQPLHPFYGYGFLTTEHPQPVNPGK